MNGLQTLNFGQRKDKWKGSNESRLLPGYPDFEEVVCLTKQYLQPTHECHITWDQLKYKFYWKT